MAQFPWYACQSVFGKEAEPETAPDELVGTSHVFPQSGGSHRHQCMNVCMDCCNETVSLNSSYLNALQLSEDSSTHVDKPAVLCQYTQIPQISMFSARLKQS